MPRSSDLADLVVAYRAHAKQNNPDCTTPGPPAPGWIGITDHTKDGLLIGIGYYCPEHWRDERPCWSACLLPVITSRNTPD